MMLRREIAPPYVGGDGRVAPFSTAAKGQAESPAVKIAAIVDRFGRTDFREAIILDTAKHKSLGIAMRVPGGLLDPDRDMNDPGPVYHISAHCLTADPSLFALMWTGHFAANDDLDTLPDTELEVSRPTTLPPSDGRVSSASPQTWDIYYRPSPQHIGDADPDEHDDLLVFALSLFNSHSASLTKMVWGGLTVRAVGVDAATRNQSDGKLLYTPEKYP